MVIVLSTPTFSIRAFQQKAENGGHTLIQVSSAADFAQHPGADFYLDAAFDGHFHSCAGPLLVHAPGYTYEQLSHAPASSARVCCWPGFAERSIWEIVPHPQHAVIFNDLLSPLGITCKAVPDIAGFIAPRILCTLINEAAYTLSDGTATEADIDIAMKLGTNYPWGPLEWARKIGGKAVADVLSAMALERPSYAPHPLLYTLSPASVSL